MKRFISILTSAFILLLFASCAQDESAEDVLENDEQRQEIMETIAGDHEMMNEMMTAIMDSKHGSMMMQNQEMMHEMMKDQPEMMGNMMRMMQGDSSMRNQMAGMMANHKPMMRMMMKRMHGKGMMSEECLQSCMERMSSMDMDEGMMMQDGDQKDGSDMMHQ